jgi:hypothetical protein
MAVDALAWLGTSLDFLLPILVPSVQLVTARNAATPGTDANMTLSWQFEGSEYYCLKK